MKVLCRALALLLILTGCSAAQARQTRHFTFEERGEVIGRLYRLGLENDRRHIGTFCEALKDRNPEVREAAIAQLVFTHDETALEPVIEAMKDDSRQVRRCAIAVLERIGSPEAIPVVTEALTYRPPDYGENEPLRFEEYFNRLAAALALHRLGSDAGRPTVLECLETQDNKMVQTMALKAVLYMDLKEALPACIRIARNQQYFGEDSPGLFALRALWHVGDDAHKGEIVKVALEKSDSIGMHAPIWTLALLVKSGDQATAQVFKDTLATTPHHEHQYQCILGLEKFKPEGSAEVIVSRVLPPKEYDEETGEVQWAREYKVFKMACDALGAIGDKSAIPGIKLWYERYTKPQDHFFYRLHLASALARLEDPEGLAHLQAALTHEDAAVRRLAAGLLASLGDESSLPLLVEAVKKETEPATFGAIKAGIGKLGPVPPEVAALPVPPAPPVPEDTYGQYRYFHGWFDDCATAEAMERISGLVEELAREDVRWVFTIYYAPLSRHDHEYHRVLVQRCFDRGAEIANHTMYHNPDGRTIRAMTDDELVARLYPRPGQDLRFQGRRRRLPPPGRSGALPTRPSPDPQGGELQPGHTHPRGGAHLLGLGYAGAAVPPRSWIRRVGRRPRRRPGQPTSGRRPALRVRRRGSQGTHRGVRRQHGLLVLPPAAGCGQAVRARLAEQPLLRPARQRGTLGDPQRWYQRDPAQPEGSVSPASTYDQPAAGPHIQRQCRPRGDPDPQGASPDRRQVSRSDMH